MTLAKRVVATRLEQGHRSARSLAKAIGLDHRTVTAIESGKRLSFDRNTLTSLDHGLGWPIGTAETIALDGAPPPDEPSWVVVLLSQVEYDAVTAFVAGMRTARSTDGVHP